MAEFFGVRERFAITIGDFVGEGDSHRTVDVWAAGCWLTCDDNTAYVPHFAGRLQHSVTSLLHDASAYRPEGRLYPELSPADNYRKLCDDTNDDGLVDHFRFMDWGPTADNVRMLIFREGDTAILPFTFTRSDHHKLRERPSVRRGTAVARTGRSAAPRGVAPDVGVVGSFKLAAPGVKHDRR